MNCNWCVSLHIAYILALTEWNTVAHTGKEYGGRLEECEKRHMVVEESQAHVYNNTYSSSQTDIKWGWREIVNTLKKQRLPYHNETHHDISLSSSFSLCQGQGAARNFFTASSDSLFHPPLSLVFFFQSSSSPAFLTSLLTQSSHLSLGLPRLLLPCSRNSAALFCSLSSAILSTWFDIMLTNKPFPHTQTNKLHQREQLRRVARIALRISMTERRWKKEKGVRLNGIGLQWFGKRIQLSERPDYSLDPADGKLNRCSRGIRMTDIMKQNESRWRRLWRGHN